MKYYVFLINRSIPLQNLNILSCNAANVLLIFWSYEFINYNIHTAFNISATCFVPDVVQK
jgi:hypothetical protein